MGTVILGVIGAGAVWASRGFGGSGVSAWTALPPMDVMPPLFGPPFPPSSLIVMTVRGAGSRSASQRPGTSTSTANAAACTSTEMTAIRWKPSGSPTRSRSTSATSTSDFSGSFRDDRHLRDAGVLQLIDHFHQLLHVDGAVALQIDLFVGDGLQPLTQSRGERAARDAFLPDVDDAVVFVAGWHGDEEPFAFDRGGAPSHGQIDVDAALNHRGRDHDDDEQHEHHVNERHDVDFRQRRGDASSPAAAMMTGAAGIVNLGHLREVPPCDI